MFISVIRSFLSVPLTLIKLNLSLLVELSHTALKIYQLEEYDI